VTSAEELAEANTRLAASQAELRALIGAMSDTIIVFDAEGVYRKVFETGRVLGLALAALTTHTRAGLSA
jgi:PAS domain-containing protein